jgi:hypothetical protein
MRGVQSMSLSCYRPASYDHIVKAVTLCLWIGLIALNAFLHYFFMFSPAKSSILGITIVTFITAFTSVILVIPYLFSPSCCGLTATDLVIQRIIRSIEIPYNQIIEVKEVNWRWKGIRVGGSGGLYGYLGLFYFFHIGKVWMYVTNNNKMLLIRCFDNKQYAISPNGMDFLIEAKRLISNV